MSEIPQSLRQPPLPGLEDWKPTWPDLMGQALTMPGHMGDTYSRFYNYSLGNEVLLFMQGVTEPVNTYNRWKKMGRQVLRGSKAKAIMVPLFRKERDEKSGEDVRRIRGFKLSNSLFTVSDTEGEDLPEPIVREWSKPRALGELAIREVPFEMVNGNIQGYSFERSFAINPVAKYPTKTMMHEIGHIELGHTSLDREDQHKGVREFGAESVAFLTMHDLGMDDHFDADESRAYIQNWLRNTEVEDSHIRQVFSATTRVLKAGREPIPEVIDEDE